MGKKYLLEIEENKDGSFAWSNFAPYNTPDIEQVRMEAYEQGLSDAWETARKIYLPTEYGGIPADVLRQIFNNKSASGIFKKVSASEAVEKIRQYEQENRFCVGDEFENESGKRFVITKMDGTEIDRYMDDEGKTYCMIAKYKVMRKTGRNFPEIAEVLQKMKETNNG